MHPLETLKEGINLLGVIVFLAICLAALYRAIR